MSKATAGSSEPGVVLLGGEDAAVVKEHESADGTSEVHVQWVRRWRVLLGICHKSREATRDPKPAHSETTEKENEGHDCFAIAAVKMRTDSCVKCI
jgi:hypothetical protein